MGSGSSWKTTTTTTDPLRPSLVERAKKRKVKAKGDPNWWTVDGSSQLGDSYDFYDVHLRDDGSFYCSCEGSTGGEYRKVCSHRTAVILWRQDHDDPWTDLEEPENPSQGTLGDTAVPNGFLQSEYSSAGEMGEPSLPPTPLPETDEAPNDSSVMPAEDVEGGGVTVPDTDFDPFSLDWDDPPAPQLLAWKGEDHELPIKFSSFRQDQWHAIIEVAEHLDEGVKVVFVSAPTGAGKSLIAAAVPQLLGIPFIYTCTTHILQNQIMDEFHYAKVLKGRRNYQTLDDPSITTDDCTMEKLTLPACPSCPGWKQGSSFQTSSYSDDSEAQLKGRHCFHCHPVERCPYQEAKQSAAHSRMAVLNTSYLLSETNHLGEAAQFGNWGLVVIDEADTLEQELMRFITVEISPSMRKTLNVGLPDKKTVENSWVEWVRDELLPAIDTRLIETPQSYDIFGKPETSILRERNALKRMRRRLKDLLKPPPTWEPEGSDEEPPSSLATGWVYTGYKRMDGKGDKQPENVTVTFKPITVRDYAREYLWSHAGQFVLMSATIISPEQMAYDLGLEDGEWAVVEMPSSFPKESRPVVVRAQTAVTHKTEKQAYPILIDQLVSIMEDYPDDRILVHSNSYKLTKELFYEGRRKTHDGYQRMVTYENAKGRDQALNQYLSTSNGVLVAPSMDRGVDLHQDDCRVIVIAKVPYPSLGDDQVSARLYSTGRSGRIWYAVETIRSIVQMTGRAMRSKDDYAITYILDKQFVRLYWENQKLFPAWWREALVFDENDPRWRDILLGFRNEEVA